MVGRCSRASRNPKLVTATLALAVLLAGIPSIATATPSAPNASWQRVDSPNTGSATGRLSATDCASATDCWAVGNGWPGVIGYATLAHWTGGDWSVDSVASVPNTMTYLYDVACPSTTRCFAVGSVSNPYDVFTSLTPSYMHAVILQWDGTAWTSEELPFTYVDGHGAPDDGFSVLRSADCAAANDCWAIGQLRQEGPHSLFLHWDGHDWTRATVSSAVDSETLVLGSISCPTTGFCLAVGPFHDTFVVPDPRTPSAAIWDGTAWALASPPAAHPLAGDPPSNPMSYESWVNDISCSAANDCWAVGDVRFSEDGMTGLVTTQPLLDHWNGAEWTSSAIPGAPPAVPATAGGLETHLTGISCPAADDCWSIGYSNSKGIVPGSVDQAFVLHWDGSAWLPGARLPDPASTVDGHPSGIACPSAQLCWAVGQLFPAEQVRELLNKWDGTLWSAVSAPAQLGVVSNTIEDVTCLTPVDCWGVGSFSFGQLRRTLTQHWDGATWSVVPSPNTSEDRSNVLSAVSCASSSDCWAVGITRSWNMEYIQALALHWDGTAWTISNPVPLPAEQVTKAINNNQQSVYLYADVQLESVHCVASDDCWAVGALLTMPVTSASIVPYHSKPLFLHWDGAAWQYSPHALQQAEPMTDSILYDVTCVSAMDCTAVGQQFARLEYNFDDLLPTDGRDIATLISHWDGVAWTGVATPNVGPYGNRLHSVSCDGASCWAVGMYYVDDTYSYKPRVAPLALQTSGDGAWQVAALSVGGGDLSEVACLSATDCWAVGNEYTDFYAPRSTRAVHWDGNEWSSASVPVAPNKPGNPSSNHLFGVTCTASADCWAVGQYAFGPRSQTLALHWAVQAGTCPGGVPISGRVTILNPETGVSVSVGNLMVSGVVDLECIEGEGPVAGRIVLTLDGVAVGDEDVTTSESSPTAVWSIDTIVASGSHVLTATWFDGDDEELDSDSINLVVEAAEVTGPCDDGDAQTDDACIPGDNVAPAVVSLLRRDGLTSKLLNDAAVDLPFDGVVRDGNGCSDVLDGLVATITLAGVVTDTLEGADVATVNCDGMDDDIVDVGFTVSLPAGASEGTYTVALTATDAGDLAGGASATFIVRAPPVVTISYSDGLGHLQFPHAVPGASDLVSDNSFNVVHDYEDAQELLFDLQDFTCTGCGEILTVGFVTLLVDGVEVPYSQSQLSLGLVNPGQVLSVFIRIDEVPRVLPVGNYLSTFGVTVA